MAPSAVGSWSPVRPWSSHTTLEARISVLPVHWRQGARVSRVRRRRLKVRVRRQWSRRPSNGVQGSITYYMSTFIIALLLLYDTDCRR